MNNLLNELSTLCAEVRSENPTTRNKAVERLESILTTSKSDLIAVMRNTNNEREAHTVTWVDLFNSAIQSTLKHAAKIDATQDAKKVQTMRNKNYIYRAVVSKLIEYSLEDNNNFLPKAILFDGFIEGVSNYSGMEHFSSVYLHVLERGIYKSAKHVRDLKVNEYSRILSHLFEANTNNNQILQFEVLTTIVKTIEIAIEQVQIGEDLICYLPELKKFAQKAMYDKQKADVIKLYNLFLKELIIDYRHTVCVQTQDILLVLDSFYNFLMKPEIKEITFDYIHSSLCAIYPRMHKGDINTFGVPLKENWPKVLQKLKSMVDVEIRERKLSTQRTNATNDKYLGTFVKTAASVTYLQFWHEDAFNTSQNEEPMSRHKIVKTNDKLEQILKLVQPGSADFSEIWLAILSEIICSQRDVVNVVNLQELLQAMLNLLHNYKNEKNLHQLRLCLATVLEYEKKFLATKSIPKGFCAETWQKIIDLLINDAATNTEIIAEKHLLLQSLLAHGKLKQQHCNSLLSSLLTNTIAKRTECLTTVRQMLLHADMCGLDKTNDMINRLIVWIHEPNEKLDARSLLLNIAPVDALLVADICAIAVINFLNEVPEKHTIADKSADNRLLQLMLYKHYRRFVCLEEHLSDTRQIELNRRGAGEAAKDNKTSCLFQSNYELLMRTLNFETTKESCCKHILLDLSSLHKMVGLLSKFLKYGVFNAENFTHCPLVKRIGFFLSHLEFQLKSNSPRQMEPADLLEVLQNLDKSFSIFIASPVLLDYLEKQPLDELISFLGTALKFSAAKLSDDFDDWPTITYEALQVLVKLCASSSHCNDALAHVSSYKLNINRDIKNFLHLIELFCAQKTANSKAASWFVETLKTIFRLFYTDIPTVTTIVDMLPAIFSYVQTFHDAREDMLIALNSLLKVAFKKSYPTYLTAKLINSIRLIARTCGEIYSQQNFTTICLSTAKFLGFPSLEIQFATVNTITALMDINWLHGSADTKEAHFDFCQQLHAQIDWKHLPTTTEDMLQNSNAVTVQILVALFTFSAYYQEVALQDLVYFCALRKITEAHLYTFQQAAEHYKCSLSQLTRPFATNLVHYWIAKQYPILKFPYFLFSKTLDDFIKEHLPKIVACLLLYGKADGLKVLQRYGSDKDLIKRAFSTAYALTLPYRAGCLEAQQHSYKEHIEKLADNLNTFGVDVLNTNAESHIKAEYICSIAELFKDEQHFQASLGFPTYFQSNKWFHINLASLKKCLSFYIDENVESQENCQPFANVVTNNALVLVQVLGTLKTHCAKCVFPTESVQHFFVFCSVAELFIESVPTVRDVEDSTKNCVKFLMRDIIFFTLYYLRKAQNCDMQAAALTFLRNLLNNPLVDEFFCRDIIHTHLNDICKSLIEITNRASTSHKMKDFSLELMQSLLLKKHLSAAIPLLDEFPAEQGFAELRQMLEQKRALQCDEKDLSSAIDVFLRSKSRGVEALKATKQLISTNKANLQQNSNSLQELITRLLEIVRNSNNNNEQSMEAAICLGEIGAIRIEGFSYYMESTTALSCVASNADAMADEKFTQAVLSVLDQLLLEFEVDTLEAIYDVAEYLINSRCGAKELVSFPYFTVFLQPNMRSQNSLGSSTPIDWVAALQAADTKAFSPWICSFVSNMFEMSALEAFAVLAAKSSLFAEACLLPFIKFLLMQKDPHMDSLVALLEYFFNELNELLLDSSGNDAKSILRDKRVINIFLGICECIRTHNEWRVPINLLHVARACNYCQAYFMSILYLELWALEEKKRVGEKKNKEIMLDESFQESAKVAYESIGCRNAISGFLNPLKSRLAYLELDNNWADVLIEAGGSAVQYADDICTSILKRNGMLSLAAASQGDRAIDYEVYWRLGQWDKSVEGHTRLDTHNDMAHEYEKQHFNALKCLYNREENNALAAIANARKCVLSILQEISTECLQSVYKYMSWLQLLQQCEDFCQVQFSSAAPVPEIFEKWKVEMDLKYDNFRWKEQALWHQTMLFKTAGVRANRRMSSFYKDSPVVTCLLKYTKECKGANELNLAKRSVAFLKSMAISDMRISASQLYEDADICFRTGKPQIGKATLEVILLTENYWRCLHRVPALRKYGEYLMESNVETFDFVLKNLFDKASEVLDEFVAENEHDPELYTHLLDWPSFQQFEQESRKEIYQTIAKYADREYTQLNTYAQSDEFRIKCKIIKENRQAADSVGKQTKDRDKNLGAIYMKKFANLDEKEVHSVEEKRSDYLCIAMENYLKFCQVDDTLSSAAIYRITALWFANKQDAKLHEKIKDNIATVPSHKFICALNQITARLSSRHPAFIDVLKGLLVRCLQDHPQQTLYQLYPLVFAFNDSSTSSKPNDRVRIAQKIIAEGKTTANSNAIKQMENMFPALIEFANLNVGTNKNASVELSDKLRRIKNLNAVHCPTIDLPVSVNKMYNLTTIINWNASASLVGGINAPKKLICICSDGKKRPQLIKGKDDLRQDAVMQQVFAMMNDLLRGEPETAELQLVLRTYKVVPLSMRSGILEWCENTIPMGVYLGGGDGKSGAHKKYHPNDLTVNKCRALHMTHSKSDIEKRYQVFWKICENVKPVLHYFLLEKFLTPGLWFERRLAYTNSVATTSIVGYILGLGDRHTQNILLDEKTAEVIHIDFGIAFEQGKIMPTPETVPFRLTRDVVAPMGVCETNGVFKKSCEATMRVLRRNQAVITIILEVLLYDPLYIWKVVPQVGNGDEDHNAAEGKNLMAQRALLCVQNKLEGKQAGILGTSSVEVQVQRLINDAISSRNLCQLYLGWDPYL